MKGHMTELYFGFQFPPGHTMIWMSFLFQLVKSLWSWSSRNTYSLCQLSHPILLRTFAKQHQHMKSKTSAVSSFGLLPVSCIKVKYSLYTFHSRQCNLYIDINKSCTSMLLQKIWLTIFQYQFRSDLLILYVSLLFCVCTWCRHHYYPKHGCNLPLLEELAGTEMVDPLIYTCTRKISLHPYLFYGCSNAIRINHVNCTLLWGHCTPPQC